MIELFEALTASGEASDARVLDALAIFQLDISFRGLGLDVPSACVTFAQFLVAPALLARFLHVSRTTEENRDNVPLTARLQKFFFCGALDENKDKEPPG